MGQSASSRSKHYKHRLVKAVRKGDAKQLQRLLIKGQVSVNQVFDTRGCPLLCLAVRKNDLALVEAILKDGMGPGDVEGHHKGWRVHVAAESKGVSLTNVYFSLDLPDTNSADDNEEDSEDDEECPQCKRRKSSVVDGVNVDVTDRKGLSAVHISAINGATAIAKILIDRHADVNKADSLKASPLHAAAAYGHVDMCDLLLENGAVVNTSEKSSLTPLHLAVMTGGIEVARTLLQRGAWADIPDMEGRSPIHFASVLSTFRGLDDIVRTNRSLLLNLLLLKHGGAVCYMDDSQCSPMSYALIKSHWKLVRMYIDCGIRLEKEDFKHMQDKHPEALGVYEDELEEPDTKVPSLMRSCRQSIMSHIADLPYASNDTKLFSAVNQLDIPTLVKDFLKYKC
jgi:hypothetical protein